MKKKITLCIVGIALIAYVGEAIYLKQLRAAVFVDEYKALPGIELSAINIA